MAQLRFPILSWECLATAREPEIAPGEKGEIGNETLCMVHGVVDCGIGPRVSGARERLRMASSLRRMQRHMHDELCSGGCGPRVCMRTHGLLSAGNRSGQRNAGRACADLRDGKAHGLLHGIS